jgi:hypothetical protein
VEGEKFADYPHRVKPVGTVLIIVEARTRFKHKFVSEKYF